MFSRLYDYSRSGIGVQGYTACDMQFTNPFLKPQEMFKHYNALQHSHCEPCSTFSPGLSEFQNKEFRRQQHD